MKRLLVAITMAGTLTACSGGDPAGPQAEIVVGTYRLARYNFHPLPSPAISGHGETRQVVNGSLVLNADESCSESETVLSTINGVTTTEVSLRQCTYEAHDTGRLDLRFEGEVVRVASFARDVVVYSDFHRAREYRRF